MPSSVTGYALSAARCILIVGGIVFTGGTIYALITIPPAPPNSEGFATGMAYLFGGVILILSLGATGLGFALPTIVGADDPLEFNRYQRWILKGAGAFFVGGFFVGVAAAIGVGFSFGLLVWFATILLGAITVCFALVWRVGEVTRDTLARAGESIS